MTTLITAAKETRAYVDESESDSVIVFKVT